MFDFEQIKELVELISERGLEGLEVERGNFRLKISGQGDRRADGVTGEATATAPGGEAPRSGTGAGAAVERPAEGEAGAAAAATEEAEVPEDAHILTSPIVGTFYTAPSPDAEPFVRVGDRVKKGEVLCIVEAMKIMNEIESDVDGEIVDVMPKNGQPVEYGEPLFAIEEA